MRDDNVNKPEIRALALLGEQFDMAIARVEAAERAAELPRRERTWPSLLPQRRALRAAMATAVACVIGLLVYALAIDTGTTPSPEQALAEVSAVARLQPMPADDQYTYTKALVLDRLAPVEPIGSGHEDDPPGAPLLITSERSSWVSIERPGLVVNRAISVRPADPGTKVDPAVRDRALGSVTRFEHPRLGRYTFGQRSYTRAEIVRVPTDPQAIVERLSGDLASDSPEDRAFELWETITQTLTRSTAPLPPELRAGMIDALALVPGVRVQDAEVSVRGREGRAFAMTSMGVEQTIVFDVDTADVLLAESKVVTREAARSFDQPVGSPMSRFELIETAFADDLPDVSER